MPYLLTFGEAHLRIKGPTLLCTTKYITEQMTKKQGPSCMASFHYNYMQLLAINLESIFQALTSLRLFIIHNYLHWVCLLTTTMSTLFIYSYFILACIFFFYLFLTYNKYVKFIQTQNKILLFGVLKIILITCNIFWVVPYNPNT